VKELKGFKKIMLRPGESREVKFVIKNNDLAFYRKDMTFGTEPGNLWCMQAGTREMLKK